MRSLTTRKMLAPMRRVPCKQAVQRYTGLRRRHGPSKEDVLRAYVMTVQLSVVTFVLFQHCALE